MTARHRKVSALIAAALLAAGITAGCSNKSQQQYNDAPRTKTENNAPAQIITFPDGFANVAGKCDAGNYLHVIFHNNSSYGSVAVVPNDPRCNGIKP